MRLRQAHPPVAIPGILTHELLGEDGDIILLLNGGMMTIAAWGLVSRRLTDGYRTLCCDFRGQLLSPGEGHVPIDGNVDDLVRLLDFLGLDSVHVAGTSFGGEVALLLAARHPHRVRTLLISNALDRTPAKMAESTRELRALCAQVVAGGDSGPFHEMLVEQVYSPAFLEAHSATVRSRRDPGLPPSFYSGLLGILGAVEIFDINRDAATLSQISCPTLVLHAAQDRIMPLERVQALAHGIAGAEFLVHPTSGHALVIEDPDWLVSVYRQFLDRHEYPPAVRDPE
ncbi:MAG: alpha/beta hydrolase [Thermoanaerobaculia bacterium]|nr:alpha/beta hydrolase [Thermoanaerobaculia bacterium]